MHKAALEAQADRIEALLNRHKILARVTWGILSPRWIQFRVLPALGTRVGRIKGLT